MQFLIITLLYITAVTVAFTQKGGQYNVMVLDHLFPALCCSNVVQTRQPFLLISPNMNRKWAYYPITTITVGQPILMNQFVHMAQNEYTFYTLRHVTPHYVLLWELISVCANLAFQLKSIVASFQAPFYALSFTTRLHWTFLFALPSLVWLSRQQTHKSIQFVRHVLQNVYDASCKKV